MSKFVAALLSAAFSVVLFQAPARAGSQMTDAFLANVAANLAILDASSHMAHGRTNSNEMLAYAQTEAVDAKEVAAALVEATPTNHRVATGNDGSVVMTGRSVAVAGMTGRVEVASQIATLEAANARAPATGDLVKLGTLHGRAFEKMYFIMQLDALSQIESDYRTYISQGDDPAIATMAHEQLPGLMKRLEALTRI